MKINAQYNLQTISNIVEYQILTNNIKQYHLGSNIESLCSILCFNRKFF